MNVVWFNNCFNNKAEALMAHCQGHLLLAETVTAFGLPDWLACVTSLSSSAGVGVVRRRAGLSFLGRCYSCYSNGACLPIRFVVCSTHALTPAACIAGNAPPWKTLLLLIHKRRCSISRRPQTTLRDALTALLSPFRHFTL